MKKFNKYLIATLPLSAIASTLAISSCSCHYKDDETQAQLVYSINSKGVCIDSLSNTDKSKVKTIIVPETIDGLPVTEISFGAFKGCCNVENIELPFIGHTSDAKGYSGLFGYVFGNELYEGLQAFTWQFFANSDDYESAEIESYQFAIPLSIRTIKIVKASTINAGAFSNLSQVKNFNFEGCNIASIENYAFAYCSGIKQFDIPEHVETIGKKAFYECFNLRTISIPNSVKIVRNQAFANCSSVQLININGTVNNIEKLAFNNVDNVLVFVEQSREETWAWDEQWIDDGVSVIYDYKDGEIFTDIEHGVQVAICTDKEGNAKHAVVIQYIGSWKDTTITIPDSVNYKGQEIPITHLASSLFKGNQNTQKFILGKYLTNLGDSVFEDCKSLTQIEFPASLEVIGDNCFARTNLEEFHIMNVKTIGNGAFQDNKNLKAVYYTGSDEDAQLTTIGDNAFKGCSSLKQFLSSETIFKFRSSVIHIGAHAFDGVASNQELQIPLYTIDFSGKNQLVMKEGAFSNMGSDKVAFDLDFGETTRRPMDDIPNMAFYNTKLNEINNWPAELKTIGNYAFYETKPKYFGLEDTRYILETIIGKLGQYNDNQTIFIPSTVTKVGDYAFYGCDQCRFDLEEPTSIGKSLTIGNYAFANCSFSLNDGNVQKGFLEFGETEKRSSVTYGRYAFANCDQLRTVDMRHTGSVSAGIFYECINFGEFSTSENPIRIQDARAIDEFAFYGCENLHYLSFDREDHQRKSDVARVRWYAFANCTSLKKIEFPIIDGAVLSKCVEFDQNVYDNCQSLTECPFPSSNVYGIYQYTFARTAITEFIVPDCVESIGPYAFYDCKQLTKIVGDNYGKLTCTNISECAFANCTELVQCELNDGINGIGQQAFANCTKLGTESNPDFIIPANITKAATGEDDSGMGIKPFMGWGADGVQTIHINICSISSTTDNTVTTKWGWVLTLHGSDLYYVCPSDYTGAANSENVHFVIDFE